MARKELSDALRHEFFRSGSVLRSTFFTILSLLLAVMLLFQIWLYHTEAARQCTRERRGLSHLGGKAVR